jgi:hypothetical protein
MRTLFIATVLAAATFMVGQARADGTVCHHKVWSSGHYGCQEAEVD